METPFPKPKYIVKGEHTLGYLLRSPHAMGVLSGLVSRGGHNWINGSAPISADGSNWRPATLEDFETFRCVVPPDFEPFESPFTHSQNQSQPMPSIERERER